jgi:PIN domain nuclease of toxin-antitoxin system
MLSERGRLNFEVDCLDWIEQAIVNSNVEVLPLSPRIAIESSRLPGIIHVDPTDRILIATAYDIKAILYRARVGS